MSFLRMAAKQSPLNSRMRSGKRMLNGLKTQVGAVGDDQLRGVGEAEQALLDEHGSPRRPPAPRTTNCCSRAGICPSISSRMTWPRRRRFSAVSYERDQILGFLLHLDVTVAQHAERALAACRGSRETARQMNMPIIDLDADEADRRRLVAAGVVRRQADEALELAGDRHAARAWSCRRARAASRRRPSGRRCWMNGKGCAGSTAIGVRIGKMWVRN